MEHRGFPKEEAKTRRPGPSPKGSPGAVRWLVVTQGMLGMLLGKYLYKPWWITLSHHLFKQKNGCPTVFIPQGGNPKLFFFYPETMVNVHRWTWWKTRHGCLSPSSSNVDQIVAAGPTVYSIYWYSLPRRDFSAHVARVCKAYPTDGTHSMGTGVPSAPVDVWLVMTGWFH